MVPKSGNTTALEARTIMIFDTHAHYDDEAFDEDRSEMFKSLRENNIEYVVNVGASMESSANSIGLAANYDFIYAAVGVHPSETAELDEEKYEWLRNEAMNNPKVVAIGEIGLDYYWDEPDRETQRYWFGRQMELARQTGLPAIIHSRDAAQETYEMMKEHRFEEIGGIVHCYSYSKEMAEKFLEMGLYFGIGGVITFKNAKKLKEAVEIIPIEKIVLETDCPYLAPEPNRGKRNSSLFIPYIAKAIAEIKGMDYDDVIRITNSNARRIYFRIQEDQ